MITSAELLVASCECTVQRAARNKQVLAVSEMRRQTVYGVAASGICCTIIIRNHLTDETMCVIIGERQMPQK